MTVRLTLGGEGIPGQKKTMQTRCHSGFLICGYRNFCFCGARAVSRKTPIYFIFYLLILFVLFLIILLSRSVVGEVICQRSGVRDRGGSAEVSRVVDFDF